MPQVDKGKALGDAILSILNANAGVDTLLGAHTARWAKDGYREPQYPADPVTDCPILDLAMSSEPMTPAGAGMTDAVWGGSLWLKLRQTPGQEHHTLIVQGQETVKNAILALTTPRSGALAAVTGISLAGAFITGSKIHPTLRHDFDDPRLRVSVAEINFGVKFKIINPNP